MNADKDIRRVHLTLMIDQRKVDLRRLVEHADLIAADLVRLEGELHELNQERPIAISEVAA
jgi:hypothetical protein